MNKTTALLALRAKQLYRMIDTIGWLLGFVFLIVVTGISFQLLQTLLLASSPYSIIGAGVLVFVIDFYRKDKGFLKSIFQRRLDLSRYLAIEYLLIVSGLIGFQCWIGHIWNAIGILVIIILISIISTLYQYRQKEIRKTSISWIPNTYFELKYFVEMHFLPCLMIGGFGLLGSVHIAFYLIWAFFIVMTMPSIYAWNEPREMVAWEPNFVRQKIISYGKVFGILSAVPLVIVLIFEPAMWLVIVYGQLCIIGALCLCVSHKYAMFTTIYPSSETSNVLAIMLLVMLLPGGVLITIIYSIIQYVKAEKNMKSLYA